MGEYLITEYSCFKVGFYCFDRSKKDSDLSMYQRLSAHLTSVDLPQLDLLDSISRETKSRVETFAFSSNQQSHHGRSTQQISNVTSSTISSNTSSNASVNIDKTCPS